MHSSANILLIQKGKYLLQHRDDNPKISEPGTYSLWGGSLNLKETPEEGAVRELSEETGLVIEPSRLVKINEYNILHDNPALKGVIVILHVFALELEPDETAQCFEGQGIIRFDRFGAEDPKINGVTMMAIRDYETPA